MAGAAPASPLSPLPPQASSTSAAKTDMTDGYPPSLSTPMTAQMYASSLQGCAATSLRGTLPGWTFWLLRQRLALRGRHCTQHLLAVQSPALFWLATLLGRRGYGLQSLLRVRWCVWFLGDGGCTLPPGLMRCACETHPPPTAKVGLQYLRGDALQQWCTSSHQTLMDFVRIRVVGKGACGQAVLYRRVRRLFAIVSTHHSPH